MVEEDPPQGQTVDLEALAEGLRKALPSYARPLFVRYLSPPCKRRNVKKNQN